MPRQAGGGFDGHHRQAWSRRFDVSGRVVARTTTDARGSFRVGLIPGTYVVTADAGMSCAVVLVRVTGGPDAKVDIQCDTGIR